MVTLGGGCQNSEKNGHVVVVCVWPLKCSAKNVCTIWCVLVSLITNTNYNVPLNFCAANAYLVNKKCCILAFENRPILSPANTEQTTLYPKLLNMTRPLPNKMTQLFFGCFFFPQIFWCADKLHFFVSGNSDSCYGPQKSFWLDFP